jgi:hypothetical protein
LRVLQKRYSAQDLIRLFVFCAFPIHVWAIIIMFRSVPAWLFYMSQSDFIASIAYHLTFTIFETLLAFIILIITGLLIPRRWVPEPFLTLSCVLIVELSIMAIVFQHLVLQYASLRWMFVSCLIILAASFVILPKIPKLQQITRILTDRLAILTFLYVFFDAIGVIIVILRNL